MPFTVLERLRAEGRALLDISRRLDEVRRLCARATILRGGRVVGRCDPRAAMMVGAQVRAVTAAPSVETGRERLRLDRLSPSSPPS